MGLRDRVRPLRPPHRRLTYLSLTYYNFHRRHSALHDAPPASRLPIAV